MQVGDQAEEAARKGDLKLLYATTRLLNGWKSNHNRPVKDKTGKLLAKTSWTRPAGKMERAFPANPKLSTTTGRTTIEARWRQALIAFGK